MILYGNARRTARGKRCSVRARSRRERGGEYRGPREPRAKIWRACSCARGPGATARSVGVVAGSGARDAADEPAARISSRG